MLGAWGSIRHLLSRGLALIFREDSKGGLGVGGSELAAETVGAETKAWRHHMKSWHFLLASEESGLIVGSGAQSSG